MNEEIKSIIKDMKSRRPKDDEIQQTPYNLQNHLSVQMAHLLVLLAEETEKQSQILIKQTEQLIRFTRWLIFFTIIIVGLTVVLILQAFKVLPESKPQLHQGNYDANKSYFYAYKEIETDRFVTIKPNDII